MNFRKATTPAKLNWLADQLLRPSIAKRFNQATVGHCTVGIGMRLDSRGRFGTVNKATVLEDFSKRYGITYRQTVDLFTASYGALGINARDKEYPAVTPAVAADILRRLAAKYDRQQKRLTSNILRNA